MKKSQTENIENCFLKRLKLFLIVFAIVFVFNAGETFAQNTVDSNIVQTNLGGTIYGRVIDEKEQGLDFATVQAFSNNILKGTTKADINGNYKITPIPAGEYTLRVTFVGLQTKEITGIALGTDGRREVNIKMVKGHSPNNQGAIRTITKPIIDYDQPSKINIKGKEIKHIPLGNEARRLVDVQIRKKVKNDMRIIRVTRIACPPIIDPSNPNEKVLYRSDIKHMPLN